MIRSMASAAEISRCRDVVIDCALALTPLSSPNDACSSGEPNKD